MTAPPTALTTSWMEVARFYCHEWAQSFLHRAQPKTHRLECCSTSALTIFSLTAPRLRRPGQKGGSWSAHSQDISYYDQTSGALLDNQCCQNRRRISTIGTQSQRLTLYYCLLYTPPFSCYNHPPPLIKILRHPSNSVLEFNFPT